MKLLETNNPQKNERGSSRFGVLGAIGVTALSALAILPRSHEAPQPNPEPESYTDQAQASAQEAYDPATDEIVIDGIRVKPGDAARNTASEAVLSSPRVQEFMAENPDEVASLESSALALPSNESGEYVVVVHDIDGDGDLDAVAKSKE